MIIKMRFDNKYQEIEVDAMDAGMWMNITIDECESQENFEKRIQEKIEKMFNKGEYNNWHKHNRHTGNAKMRNKEGVVEVNTDEAIMARAIDQSIFTRDIDELIERIDHECQYEYYRDYLRSILKPSQADMIIAIVLDGMTVGEYAASIGEDSNNVSHRYRRVINKLKNVFTKTSF